MTETRDPAYIATSSDGRIVQRPMSPHLGIYRLPVTMAASILNRATGIALSLGAVLLVWWLAAAAAGPSAFAGMQHFLASPVGLLLLFGWTVSLAYHLLSGLRHLAWDCGLGFAPARLDAFTWAVLAGTCVLTAIVWIAGYFLRGA